MFHNTTILITWWTGTWWQAIVQSLLEKYQIKKVIVLSRSEDRQVQMERIMHSSKIQFVLWDIRNWELLKKVLHWVDYVIHLAALKHISKCQENPEEAISINVQGTQNLIDAAIFNKVKKVLYVSTDKAVDPYNLYGNTKAIWEQLCIHANVNQKETIFSVLRAGNVLWSNGSVVQVLFHQIMNHRPLTITNPNTRRFYITINEIIDLIYFSFCTSIGWEIFIHRWRVISLKDLTECMIGLYWRWNEEILQIGMRNWEKQDEILISRNESSDILFLNDSYFLLDILGRHTWNFPKVDMSEWFWTYENHTPMTEQSRKVLEWNLVHLLEWKYEW